MPAKSPAQHRFMAMIANKKGMSGLHGITKGLAKEFITPKGKRKKTLFSRG